MSERVEETEPEGGTLVIIRNSGNGMSDSRAVP